jgi:tetratricopeptide (TPR) repeat protein
MKLRSGLRIAFSVVALLAARVGANAAGCWQGIKHYNQGVDLQDKGDLDGAITEYRTSIGQCPTFWRPVYNLGTVLEAKGDLEGAIRQYRNVISEWPTI